MSMILKPDIKPISASMLTLVTALSVVKAIQQTTTLEAKIKWPNDIIVNRKKVCGDRKSVVSGKRVEGR